MVAAQHDNYDDDNYDFISTSDPNRCYHFDQNGPGSNEGLTLHYLNLEKDR